MDTNMKPINEENSRAVKLSLLGAGFAGFCVLFFLMFGWFQPDRFSLSDRYFPSPTATWTRTPTLTPTMIPTRTPSATPTITSSPTLTFTPTITLTPHVLLAPPEGVTVLEETFDSNARGWATYFPDNTLRIKNGRLFIRSDKLGLAGVALCFDCIEYGQAFYFQAELLPESDVSTMYGLAFCATTDENQYYSFTINPTRALYRLSKHRAGSSYVMKSTYTKSTNQYPVTNILGVYFNEGRMDIYINNVLTGSYTDPHPFECQGAGVIISKGEINLTADNIFTYRVKTNPK